MRTKPVNVSLKLMYRFGACQLMSLLDCNADAEMPEDLLALETRYPVYKDEFTIGDKRVASAVDAQDCTWPEEVRASVLCLHMGLICEDDGPKDTM